ncbi:MAG: helix-turn-helix domain-containing protein [Candidatus Acidiferrales bacterium]
MRPATRRRVSVCLVSPHAMALAELERRLKPPQFRVVPVRVEFTMVADLRRLRIPRAEVYILDAAGTWPATAALAGKILDRYPSAILLVVAEKYTENAAFTLLRLGAKGLIRYTEVQGRLPRAIRTVAEGGYWVSRRLLSRFVDWILSRVRARQLPVVAAALSRREGDVLDALLENLSNKEIATKLNISERTVKFHVSNVLAKFGVRRRADLIVLSYQASPAGR